MADIIEHDSTAFVVYVPPLQTVNPSNNATTVDTSVESCLRLGAGPATSP